MIIHSLKDIKKLKSDLTEITVHNYLTYPLVKKLVDVVPNLKTVVVPNCYGVRKSQKALSFLKEHNIKINYSKKRGPKPKYPIKLVDTIRKEIEVNKLSYSKIQEKYDIPKSSINYLLTLRKS